MFEIFNKIVWAIATSLLIITTISYTFNLKFLQFNFKKIFKSTRNNKDGSGISTLETLMMTLGGKIGIGSIAGVALGIYIGGIGSLFWLWITCLLSSILAYAETVLGIVYRTYYHGVPVGGPSYYIKKGLSNNKLAVLYSILILVSYIGGFLSIQANTIVKSLNSLITIDSKVVGIILVIITFLCIIGGLKKIAKISSILVPFMCLLYLFCILLVVILNIGDVPRIIELIIKSGLDFRSLKGGIVGTIIVGIQRGIFSSEAGIGTSSIISSSSNDSACKQGYVQIIGVYITGLVICTLTAIIMFLSPYETLSVNDINGIELIHFAFNYHFGYLGDILLFCFIFMFSFSTIITGYYYGEASLKFIFNRLSNYKLSIFKFITLLFLFLGSCVKSEYLWNIVDFLVAILVIINSYALLELKGNVKEETDCYKLKSMVK